MNEGREAFSSSRLVDAAPVPTLRLLRADGFSPVRGVPAVEGEPQPGSLVRLPEPHLQRGRRPLPLLHQIRGGAPPRTDAKPKLTFQLTAHPPSVPSAVPAGAERRGEQLAHHRARGRLGAARGQSLGDGVRRAQVSVDSTHHFTVFILS